MVVMLVSGGDHPPKEAAAPAPRNRHRHSESRHTAELNLLAAVVESSEDAIITKDLNGIITSWNPGAERVFGYTAEEMIGQPITRLFPDDRLGEEPGILERVASGQRVEHFETKRIRKDGATIDVSVTISPLRDEHGNIVGASKIARDVTEQRRAQAERSLLAAIVQSSSDAILTKNLDGTVTSWNDAASKLYGYSAGEMLGRPVTVLFPRDRLQEEQRIIAAIRAGERVEPFETQRRRQDGTLIDVSVTVSPILGAGGVVVGASNVARDITRQKRQQELELGRAAAEIEYLRKVSEFRTRFINAAAHELANPLTPITIQVCMLRQAELPTEHRHSVEVLDRNFQRLARGIRDLLDAARVQSGRLHVDPRPLPLRPLLEEAADSFRGAAAAAGVEVAVDGVPTLDLRMDPDRILQVLYNLVANAIKFTPKGGRIVIGARRLSEDVEIWVRDNGVGLTREQQAQIFAPYSQVHSGPGQRRGMGLGLFISRAIVEAHGGSLRVESPGPGLGATFTASLPG